MTDELLITIENDTGQLILEGARTGAAGGAILTPVPGLELLFDRANGRLCRVTADLAEHSGADGDDDSDRTVQHTLIRLFGARAEQNLRNAVLSEIAGRALSPDPALAAAFSRLARFDAARATSPVPATSPFWSTEAAVLALRAGLHERAYAEARDAVTGLAAILPESPLPDELFGPAMLVAALAQADKPDAAEVVRAESGRGFVGPLSEWLATYGSPPSVARVSRDPGLSGNPAASPTAGPGRLRSMRWGLDLTLLPAGLVLPGLTPDTDLIVCLERPDCVRVKVRLDPGADDRALRPCRARLVDPAARRVVAVAPVIREGSMAAANLQIPDGLDGLGDIWIEIVADEERPVRGGTLREMRQALRWADSALRAQRRPRGLAPQVSNEGWGAMSAAGWETCGRYWEFAGDGERAAQAASNAAMQPHPLADEPGFLAETLGR